MSMQNEGENVKGRDEQQGTRNETGNADRFSTGGTGGTGDTGVIRGPAAGKGSQQSGQQASQQGAMPPSQTDDDQYDQGTVQRER